MKEILKSTLLQYEKSTFLIDIIKHYSGQRYINIKQTIEGIDDKQELKINFSILSDIIFVLENYKREIVKDNFDSGNTYFSDVKQKSIVERYLKGISIEGLALQFNCTKQIIEQILFNKRIAIVDQDISKRRRRNKKF